MSKKNIAIKLAPVSCFAKDEDRRIFHQCPILTILPTLKSIAAKII